MQSRLQPNLGQRQGLASITYKVLFDFGSSVSGIYGAFPEAGLVQIGRTLYGTTIAGGGHGGGTVYGVTPDGHERVLHSFFWAGSGYNGPAAALLALNGVLYGTTVGGGAYGLGEVFSLNPSTQGFHVLHNFVGGQDGAQPVSSLTALNGTLYGTTSAGGVAGLGTVFSINPISGSEQVLHDFEGQSSGGDGAIPEAGLIGVSGKLFGTTFVGGTADWGTVFSMTTGGNVTVLHSFTGKPDGIGPVAPLLALNGLLYGTTKQGGVNNNNAGTAFSVSIKSAKERVLHSFGEGSDGTVPTAGLVALDGTFYGTTYSGGTVNEGTVYSITRGGTESVLHSFTGDYVDGVYPLGGLALLNGTLYGTTYEGGVSLPSCPFSAEVCDYGTIFALRP